jgi:hypothetical protein
VVEMNQDRAKILQRVYMLRAQNRQNEAEVKSLLDSLGEMPLGKDVAGDLIVEVSLTRKFDPGTAKKNLTPEDYQRILLPKPDSALAKALLGEDYEKTQRTYGQTVRVYPPGDEE